MRFLYVLIIIFAAISFQGFSQPKAMVDYRAYPLEDKLFLYEFYYDFNADYLSLGEAPNNTYAVEIVLEILKDTNLLAFDKVICNSKPSTDGENRFLFSHHVAAPNDNYQVAITLRDLNSNQKSTVLTQIKKNKENRFKISSPFVVYKADSNQTGILNKSGIKMSPDLYRIRNNGEKTIYTYHELAFDKNDDAFYMLRNSLIDKKGKMYYQKIRKLKGNEQSVHPILEIYPLGDIKTKGDYFLKTELYSKSMDLLYADSTDFFYSPKQSPKQLAEMILNTNFIKSINSRDTLIDYIYSLEPIANDAEQKRILQQETYLRTDSAKKTFFYTFWVSRDGETADQAWLAYRKEVEKVNASFSTPIRKGYETQRGRIYLKYGEPNVITDRPSDPESYPYQIWHYHRLGNYNDVRFVFYNRDGVSNDYDLLHAEIPGEVRNPQWRMVLNSRTQTSPIHDQTNPQGAYGNRSQDFFNNPR